ncbi:hypothetical protein EYR38_004981 [Pleurotus pulmonarius]|nr:hypothetical protein EYR38_004981 [Pleurotus pulmonarius]
MCDACWAACGDKRKRGRPANISQGSRGGQGSGTTNAHGDAPLPNISTSASPPRDSDSSSLSSAESPWGFEQSFLPQHSRDQSPATPYSPTPALDSSHSHFLTPSPYPYLQPYEQGFSPSYPVYNLPGVPNANAGDMPPVQMDTISPYMPVHPIPTVPNALSYPSTGPELMSPLPSPALPFQSTLPPDGPDYYQDPPSSGTPGFPHQDHDPGFNIGYQGTPPLAVSDFSELSHAVDPAQGQHSGHYAETSHYAPAQSQDTDPGPSSLFSGSEDALFHPAPARQGSGDTVKMDVDQDGQDDPDEGSGSSQDTVGGFTGYLNSKKKLSPPASLRTQE